MHFFVYLAILVSASLASTKGDVCGGLLEADAGQYELDLEEAIHPGMVCVWIVKSVSRTTVRFSLQKLGQGLTVSLYGEHSPSQVSLEPIRLTNVDQGRNVDSDGQTLVVVLTQNGTGREFNFAWDSLEPAGLDYLTAANYIQNDSGTIHWNRFGYLERLTLSLNAETTESLYVEANSNFSDCSLFRQCQCSYVAMYELGSDGYLREVLTTCGRSLQVQAQHLLPNVLAFVYLNSSLQISPDDYAEIRWSTSKMEPPATTEPSSSATTETGDGKTEQSACPTTQTEAMETTLPVPSVPPPGAPVRDCGGVVEIGRDGFSVIAYLPDGGYLANEFCLWTLLPREKDIANLSLVVDLAEFGDSLDGLVIYSWGSDGQLGSRAVRSAEIGVPIIINGPYAALAFSSDRSVQSLGFRASIIGSGQSSMNYTHTSFLFNGTQGNFSYPKDVGGSSYRGNEVVSVIIHTERLKTKTVTIDSVDIQDDLLRVYQLLPFGNSPYYQLTGITTGYNPSPSLITNSQYPRLLLFSSNSFYEGQGFSLSWADA